MRQTWNDLSLGEQKKQNHMLLRSIDMHANSQPTPFAYNDLQGHPGPISADLARVLTATMLIAALRHGKLNIEDDTTFQVVMHIGIVRCEIPALGFVLAIGEIPNAARALVNGWYRPATHRRHEICEALIVTLEDLILLPYAATAPS